MEARLGKKGKREFVQTLRLLETFKLPEVEQAIGDALRMGTISFDAVKHLLLSASSSGRRGWIWRTIRTCLWRRWRPRPPPIIWLCWVLVDGYAPGFTRSSSENAAAPHVPARVRQARTAVCRRGRGLSALPAALSELELLDRERRATERRIRQAKFEVVKSLDTFDFLAIPSLNKALVLDLARSEFIERKENVLALGNSGTGKTHIALALGLAACQKGFRVRFTTAASLAHELIEAKDERRLMRFQKMLSSFELLIIDELGFVPLSKTGAELLFEVFSRRYERSATLVTSNRRSTNGPRLSDPSG